MPNHIKQREPSIIRLLLIVAIFTLVCLAAIALADDAASGTFWLYFIPQGLACLWAGWALREWAWIVGALAILPVFLAMPFGLPDEIFLEGPPIALFELLLFPVYAGLVVIGVAVRRRMTTSQVSG